PRRVRCDDHVRGKPAGQDADAAARDLHDLRIELRHRDRDRCAADRDQPRDLALAEAERALAQRPAVRTRARIVTTLSVDFRLPLRSYDLELALEVEGTVALVGPSGAGKTSALRAVTGLVRPASGRIALDGSPWFDARDKVFLKPEERRVG